MAAMAERIAELTRKLAERKALNAQLEAKKEKRQEEERIGLEMQFTLWEMYLNEIIYKIGNYKYILIYSSKGARWSTS